MVGHFGGIDFSKGVRVIEINYTNGGTTTNLLSTVLEQDRPILHSKNDFIELLVVMQISSSFAEAEVGKFIGHSNVDLNKNGNILDNQTVSFLLGVNVNEKEKYYQLMSDGQLPVLLGQTFDQTKNKSYVAKNVGNKGYNVKLIVENNILFQKNYSVEKVLGTEYFDELLLDNDFKNKVSSLGTWSTSNGKLVLSQSSKITGDIYFKIF